MAKKIDRNEIVRVCPKCGFTRTQQDWLFRQFRLAELQMEDNEECPNCGAILEIPEEEKDA